MRDDALEGQNLAPTARPDAWTWGSQTPDGKMTASETLPLSFDLDIFI